MTKLGTISTCLPETGWRRRWSWPQWAVDFVAIAPQAHRQRHQQAEPEAQPCVELEYAEKSHAAVADDAKDVAKMTDFEHIWDYISFVNHKLQSKLQFQSARVVEPSPGRSSR